MVRYPRALHPAAVLYVPASGPSTNSDSDKYQCVLVVAAVTAANSLLYNFLLQSSKRSAPPPPPGFPRIYELMRVFLRRRDVPWEVVDHKSVQPVPTFFDDEDVDILKVSSGDTRGTYVFELHASSANKRSGRLSGRTTRSDVLFDSEHRRKALIFARQQLLSEIAKKDCNVLLLEGWRLTVLRKGKRVRIEVQYNGRGALAAGKPDLAQRQPPFIELLARP